MDIDKDIVLPLLQPVISSISLPEISHTVQELVQRQVSKFTDKVVVADPLGFFLGI